MSSRKKIVILDVMSLAYKAYFAFITRPLKTKAGEPTSAVYGFLTQLIKILEETKPDAVVAAFDSKEKTFRHTMYPAYKSNRAEMPEDMVPQIGRIREVIEAFNIPVMIQPGLEADDLAGITASAGSKIGYNVILLSPDKDYIQLINENVTILRPVRGSNEFEELTPTLVREKYGFEPLQIIDYLALIGDSSDFIPGVPGIGEKTALPLIQKYGTIEAIYENIESVTPAGVKGKLEKGKESAFLSKQLITIVTEGELSFDLSEAHLLEPDIDRIERLFSDLEFRNLFAKVKKLYGTAASEVPSVEQQIEVQPENAQPEEVFDALKVTYTLITDRAAAKVLAVSLREAGLFVFDTETDGLNPFQAQLAGIAFCTNPGKAAFVAVDGISQAGGLFESAVTDRLSLSDCREIFGPLLADPSVKKVCQNAKFDINILRCQGMPVQGVVFDTMVASYIIDPDQKHNMDDLSRKYLNYSPIPLSALLGSKKEAKRIFDVDLDKLKDYSAEDADITFRLYLKLKALLDESGLNQLAEKIEFPLIEVLSEMELAGVKIDILALQDFSNELEKLIQSLTEEIYSIAGEEFNINSPQQLQKILYGNLRLQPTKKTKTGYSTDAQTLEDLQDAHPIIPALLKFRQVTKLKSTYADALPKLIEPSTQRIHTSFNQTIASTGRLSSVDPNLQNIPIRTEMGKEIRKAFVPSDKNNTLISLDYSQIELRILAAYCGDEFLQESFRKGLDIHTSTAARVFQVDLDKITPDMRRKAKEVNFGIIYGIGAFGLKNRLGITQTEAKNIIDNYFMTFPGIRHFIDQCIAFAKEHGYAETMMKRRRFLPNINSRNAAVRQFEERVAVNMPIQGSAADMIKLAMISIQKELKLLKVKTRMVLQVHDELLFDAPKKEAEELIPILKRLMEEAMPLSVPLVAEAGMGDNWLEAH